MNKTHTTLNQIYKGGEGASITLDLHVWIECDGAVSDYDDKQLKKMSAYGTNNIVRVPFPNKLAAKCLPLVMEVAGAKMKMAQEYNVVEESFHLWMNQPGNCCCRAMLLYKRMKEMGLKPKIKIGSLGFIQKNKKDIFYEYG